MMKSRNVVIASCLAVVGLLLAGNADGTVAYFEGYEFLIRRLTCGADANLTLEWNSAPFLKYHVLAGPTPDRITNAVAQNQPSTGQVTCWTNPGPANQQFYKLQIAP